MTNLKILTPYEIEGNEILKRIKEINITNQESAENARKELKNCQSLKKEIEEKRNEVLTPLRQQTELINDFAKEVNIPVSEAESIIKGKLLDYDREQQRIKQEKENEAQLILNKISTFQTADELQDYIDFLENDDPRIPLQQIKQLANIKEKVRKEEEDKKRKEDEERLLELQKSNDKEKAEIEMQRIEIEKEKREIEERKKQKADKEAEYEAQKLADKTSQETVKIKGIKTLKKREIIDDDQVERIYCSHDSKKINQAIKDGIKEIKGIRIWEEKIIC